MTASSPRVFVHRGRPREIVFPVEARVPESKRHLKLRTALLEILEHALGEGACVCSDQFVYWNGSDPRMCLAPDVFLRRGVKPELVKTWKTWERGAPELSVEIVSASDEGDVAWEEKLERYHALGVLELVRFDPEAAEGARVRVWDRVKEDLVEREVGEDRTPSAVLAAVWFVAEDRELGPMLRLESHDGAQWPTPREAEARGREVEARGREVEARGREAEARGREAEAKGRDVAERRVRELEEELRRRG